MTLFPVDSRFPFNTGWHRHPTHRRPPQNAPTASKTRPADIIYNIAELSLENKNAGALNVAGLSQKISGARSATSTPTRAELLAAVNELREKIGWLLYCRRYDQGLHKVVTNPQRRVVSQTVVIESELITQYAPSTTKDARGVIMGVKPDMPTSPASSTGNSAAGSDGRTDVANGKQPLASAVPQDNANPFTDVNPSSTLRSTPSQISGIPDAAAAERLRASTDAGGAWLTGPPPPPPDQVILQKNWDTPTPTPTWKMTTS
ncbi:MAG: hypothetical protein LBT53_02760 [Puniceicoccales bacterium]|nr:hypothetical protein [Puniceicoccales bacterium]